MTLKRYDCGNGDATYCYGCYRMEEDSHGEYVTYEDYVKLEAANLATMENLNCQDNVIAELESQIPRWISVHDALPESPINVIIAGDLGYYCDGVWWSAITHRELDWDVKWWMPLPQPPESQEG